MKELVEIGGYVRELGASLERLIENALDWEHLPHLHAGSFAAIQVVEHGPNGWRAETRLADGTPLTLDLRLQGPGWITRTFAGRQLTSEIRSRAEAIAQHRCRVSVTFHVAGVPEEKRAAVGERYRQLYKRLYDEDERMMVARAEAIHRGPAALRQTRTAVLPDGRLATVPVYCPHQGLPLDAEPDADGIVICPWHGYRIDTLSGRCTPPHRLL